MNTRDLLLMELYHTTRDPQIQALAARHAPQICFDTREPFLPLAAGYTLFGEDCRSYSMDRIVTLAPEGKPPAALAIEYAIWWDWDIHHLYELEHVWVYLDSKERPVRVEASWHGEYNEIPLKMHEGHVVVLSEPGKHAFGPDAEWFRKRSAETRRQDTEQVGMQSHVLINDMFSGKIRERVFDSTLARSFLARHAFTPSWNFEKMFLLQPEHLVPWPVLLAWIPRRVNATLERLDWTIRPEMYRPLHLAQTSGTWADVQRAAQTGGRDAAPADALLIPLRVAEGRLVLAEEPAVDLPQVFGFCKTEPVAAFLEVDSDETAQRLGQFLTEKKMAAYAVIVSDQPAILQAYQAATSGGITALRLASAEQAQEAVQHSGARYIVLDWPEAARGELTTTWLRKIQSAGVGVITWPVSSEEEARRLSRMGVDVIQFSQAQGA